jgi:hypothetical protein
VRPFRIGGDVDALWEFPIAVLRQGRMVLPLGGGAYWRALPGVVLWHGLDSLSRRSTFPVLYFHPYEFADDALRVVLPPQASSRERVRETWRRVSKNTRRDLICARLREAAARFRLVPVRDIFDAARDDLDATLLRQTRARV